MTASAPGIPAPLPLARERAHGDQASRLRAMAQTAARPGRAEDRGAVSGSRGPGKVIAVGSGKGGVGKTSLAVNLAIALGRTGRRVTLVDADLGTANVDVVCGISPARRLDAAFADAARGMSMPLGRLVVETPLGFRLLPGAAGVARAADATGEQRRRLVDGIHELRSDNDFVIVDVGAGVGAATRCLMLAADRPLVVATPEPASIADAYALVKCLHFDCQGHGFDPFLVVNQTGSVREGQEVHTRLQSVTRRFLHLDLPLLGVVAWDRDMVLAARTRRPLLSTKGRSAARKDFHRLAGDLARMGSARTACGIVPNCG